jgi:hypothetical protein
MNIPRERDPQVLEPAISSAWCDLAGLGKIAEAIPPEVYTRTTDTLLITFEKLIAPITQTTHGLGDYIQQKFQNMVRIEKALAEHALTVAFKKARAEAEALRVSIVCPAHTKSFVRSLEEASKETDPLVSNLWSSLLASQLLEGRSHPHFVETLTHFSPSEAKLLASIRSRCDVGENGGNYISYWIDAFSHWITDARDRDPKPWGLPCRLLCEFGFADVLSTDGDDPQRPTILYRTRMGDEFLAAVTTGNASAQQASANVESNA